MARERGRVNHSASTYLYMLHFCRFIILGQRLWVGINVIAVNEWPLPSYRYPSKMTNKVVGRSTVRADRPAQQWKRKEQKTNRPVWCYVLTRADAPNALHGAEVRTGL